MKQKTTQGFYSGYHPFFLPNPLTDPTFVSEYDKAKQEMEKLPPEVLKGPNVDNSLALVLYTGPSGQQNQQPDLNKQKQQKINKLGTLLDQDINKVTLLDNQSKQIQSLVNGLNPVNATSQLAITNLINAIKVEINEYVDRVKLAPPAGGVAALNAAIANAETLLTIPAVVKGTTPSTAAPPAPTATPRATNYATNAINNILTAMPAAATGVAAGAITQANANTALTSIMASLHNLPPPRIANLLANATPGISPNVAAISSLIDAIDSSLAIRAAGAAVPPDLVTAFQNNALNAMASIAIAIAYEPPSTTTSNIINPASLSALTTLQTAIITQKNTPTDAPLMQQSEITTENQLLNRVKTRIRSQVRQLRRIRNQQQTLLTQIDTELQSPNQDVRQILYNQNMLYNLQDITRNEQGSQPFTPLPHNRTTTTTEQQEQLNERQKQLSLQQEEQIQFLEEQIERQKPNIESIQQRQVQTIQSLQQEQEKRNNAESLVIARRNADAATAIAEAGPPVVNVAAPPAPDVNVNVAPPVINFPALPAPAVNINVAPAIEGPGINMQPLIQEIRQITEGQNNVVREIQAQLTNQNRTLNDLLREQQANPGLVPLVDTVRQQLQIQNLQLENQQAEQRSNVQMLNQLFQHQSQERGKERAMEVSERQRLEDRYNREMDILREDSREKKKEEENKNAVFRQINEILSNQVRLLTDANNRRVEENNQRMEQMQKEFYEKMRRDQDHIHLILESYNRNLMEQLENQNRLLTSRIEDQLKITEASEGRQIQNLMKQEETTHRLLMQLDQMNEKVNNTTSHLIEDISTSQSDELLDKGLKLEALKLQKQLQLLRQGENSLEDIIHPESTSQMTVSSSEPVSSSSSSLLTPPNPNPSNIPLTATAASAPRAKNKKPNKQQFTQLRTFFEKNQYVSVMKSLLTNIQPHDLKTQYISDNTHYLESKGERQKAQMQPDNITLTRLTNLSGNVYIKQTGCDNDSFFKMIADSLNEYNSIQKKNENEGEVITYEMNGREYDVDFDPNVVREMLVRSIFDPQNATVLPLENLLTAVKENQNFLNEEFNKLAVARSDVISEAAILTSVDDIYETYRCKTFLISKTPSSNTPFSVMTSRNEIQSYILSGNFWVNDLVVPYIERALKLALITVKISSNPEINPTVSYSRYDVDYPKFMFIYFLESFCCYQKIDFVIYEPTPTKRISIFNSNATDIMPMPPFTMLLLIYGSYYLQSLTQRERDGIVILRQQLQQINDVYERIVNANASTSKTKGDEKIVGYFNGLFPHSHLSGGGKRERERERERKSRSQEIQQIKKRAILTRKNRIQKGGASRYTRYREPKLNNAKLSYYVSIVLYLYENDKQNPPGKIPFSYTTSLSCNQNTNQLHQAVAELLGTQHFIQPHYLPSYQGYRPPLRKRGGGITLKQLKNKAIQNRITRRNKSI